MLNNKEPLTKGTPQWKYSLAGRIGRVTLLAFVLFLAGCGMSNRESECIGTARMYCIESDHFEYSFECSSKRWNSATRTRGCIEYSCDYKCYNFVGGAGGHIE